MLTDPEQLHDKDWLETKTSDEFFVDSTRYKDITEIIIQQRPRIVLDVGCGSGFISRTIKAKLPALIVDGADI